MNAKSKPDQSGQPQYATSGDASHEALYDRFVEKTNELFDIGQEKSAVAWEIAMEAARQQMAVAGEFTAEQGEVFKRYLRRDLAHTVTDMRKLGASAKEHLNPARVGAGALSTLSRVMHATGDALLSLSEKTEAALLYKTGEVTMAGTLTCTACGKSIQLKKTGVVPPCPGCNNTNFRKGY